jgi:hypothetical protein
MNIVAMQRGHYRTAMAITVLVVLVGAGCSETTSAPTVTRRAVATSATSTFFRRYVQSDGRVVRLDQGGAP